MRSLSISKIATRLTKDLEGEFFPIDPSEAKTLRYERHNPDPLGLVVTLTENPLGGEVLAVEQPEKFAQYSTYSVGLTFDFALPRSIPKTSQKTSFVPRRDHVRVIFENSDVSYGVVSRGRPTDPVYHTFCFIERSTTPNQMKKHLCAAMMYYATVLEKNVGAYAQAIENTRPRKRPK